MKYMIFPSTNRFLYQNQLRTHPKNCAPHKKPNHGLQRNGSNMIVLDIPRVYYPYACTICLKPDPNIKRCSGCKLAGYCSKYHQLIDWGHTHKNLCKVIARCNRRFTPRITNFEEWTNYRLGQRYIWEHNLKRSLNTQETLMNQFSPVCVVCFSRENLFCCFDCLSVSYCSEQHRLEHSRKHSEYCGSLKLSLVTDRYINSRGLTDIKLSTIDKQPLTSTKDVLKYISRIDCNSSHHDHLTKEEELLALNIVKTERITLGLNLLHTLNLKSTKSKIVIHIVGASHLETESDWEIITEILSNWLGISHVTYHLVGPDLNPSDCKETPQYKILHHSCLYHEIFSEIDKPDLIAAFNCGLHEYEGEKENPWALSIPKLLHFKGTPLLLTSFTEMELIKDKTIVNSLDYKMNVILDLERNPFAFLKPLRDWLSVDEPVFYRCNYIYIVERIE